MRLKLFSCHHLAPQFTCNTEIFQTLVSGVPAPDDGSFISDLGGVNIAADNMYAELRHQYFVWKNLLGDYDYVGFEHYRRPFFIDALPAERLAAEFPEMLEMRHYFAAIRSTGLKRDTDVFAQHLAMRRALDAPAIDAVKAMIGSFDIVAPRANIEDIEDQWRRSVGDMECWRVMMDGIHKSRHFADRPDHIIGFLRRCYFANMYIMRAELLDEYLAFCFDVLDYCREKLPLVGRALGYFSERVFSYWVYQKRIEQPTLRVLELPMVFHGNSAAQPVQAIQLVAADAAV